MFDRFKKKRKGMLKSYKQRAYTHSQLQRALHKNAFEINKIYQCFESNSNIRIKEVFERTFRQK